MHSRLLASRALKLTVATMVVAFASFSLYADSAHGSSSARTLFGQAEAGKTVALHQPAPRAVKAAKDLGPAAPDRELSLRLVLKRSPEQQAALEVWLAQTRTPGSPQWGATLTSAEFTETFGIADADMQKLTGWLESRGFEVVEANAGIGRVSFTGTVTQVRSAFGADIHTYVAKDGAEHIAPASAPRIPAAAASLVQRIEGLQDFVAEPLGSYDGPVRDGASKAITAQASGFPAAHARGWTSPVTLGGLTAMREGAKAVQADNLNTVTLAASLAGTQPVVFGSGTSLTVNVNVSWTAGTGPTGYLTLSDSDGALSASIALSSCTAGTNSYACSYTWTTPSAAVNGSPDTVTASYGGDSNYASSSTTTTINITYAAGTGTPSALSLTNAPNTVNQGATTQQTATFIIRGTNGQGTPSGTVMLYGSGAIGQIATFTLNATNCTSPATREYSCAVKWNPSASLLPGSYQIAAAYSGNNAIASYLVVDTAAFTVVASGTTNTTTTVTANPSTLYEPGEGTTFTTRTTWTGGGQPTGSIQLTGPAGTYGGGPIGAAVFPASGQTSSSGSGTYYFGNYTYTYNCTAGSNVITCTIVDSDVYNVLPNFGANTVTAAYSGDSTFKGSSGTATVTIAEGDDFPSSTTLSATPSTVQYGAGTSVTYTVIILDEEGADTQPTGTITLSGTPIAGGSIQYTVNATNCPYAAAYGTATCTFSSAVPTGTEPGSYTLTAQYSGDGVYSGSNGTAAFTVTGTTPTSTTATANPANITYGATVTFTSITTWTGSGATPTGTVALTCGAGSQGQCLALPAAKNVNSCTISTGAKTITCTITYNTTNATDYGSYNFVLTYSGDTTYAGSSSSIIAGIGGSNASTTTLVTGASPSINYGSTASQSWSVNVKGAAGIAAPTGIVTVSANGTLGQLGTGAVSTTCTSTGTGNSKVYTCPASGSYTASTAAAGTYSLSFVYGGDNHYTGSSAGTTLTVNADATSTSVSANPTTIGLTGSTSVTATVTNTTVSTAVPLGSITFTVGTNTVGTCTLTAGSSSSSCSATVQATSLSSGSNTIKATYNPSPANWLTSNGSTSVSVGADLTFSSVTHNLGSVPVNSTTSGSSNYGVQLKNNSTQSYTITALNITGSSEFSAAGNTCITTLAPGATCEIVFQFAPTALGTVTANWSITVSGSPTFSPSNGGTLTGTGSSNGQLTITSNGHNFGKVSVNTTSGAFGVVITNSSGSAVTLTVGNTTAPFHIVLNNCPATLAANASCNVQWTFSPTATGTVSENVPLTASQTIYFGSTPVTSMYLAGTGQ